MQIRETLDLLNKQVELSLSRDDRADLNGALANIEEALRTLKGLQTLLEDYRNNIIKELNDLENLYAPDDNEPWWNK